MNNIHGSRNTKYVPIPENRFGWKPPLYELMHRYMRPSVWKGMNKYFLADDMGSVASLKRWLNRKNIHPFQVRTNRQGFTVYAYGKKHQYLWPSDRQLKRHVRNMWNKNKNISNNYNTFKHYPQLNTQRFRNIMNVNKKRTAATKIQSVFKGGRNRKQTAAKRAGTNKKSPSPSSRNRNK